jgi:hypothetical protein
MTTPKKKSDKKTVAAELEREGFAVTADAPEVLMPPLKVVEEPKKPGEKGFDWQAEYPGEDVYVYTVPEGTRSPAGLTIGLARLTEDRAPNPGMMRTAYRDGGFAPMWLFIESVSSPVALELQDQLRPPEYNEMLRGWADFAGIELTK